MAPHVVLMRFRVSDEELERIARFNTSEFGRSRRRRATLEQYRAFVIDAVNAYWEAVNDAEATRGGPA